MAKNQKINQKSQSTRDTCVGSSAGSVTPLIPLQLKDEAFVALERMIVNGVLAPGQWVSETDLVNVSGHTRASVRSAIQRLANEGLLKTVPRRGAQVCPIDYEQHFRSLELRRVVEVLVAQSAAKRASPDQKRQFKAISKTLDTSKKPIDQEELTDADAKCFSLMIEAADNEYAARALLSVKGLSRRFWVLHQSQHGDVPRIVSAHSRVALAISRGDSEAAKVAVHDLIDYVEHFALEVIGYSKESKSAD